MNFEYYVRKEGDEPRAIALVERALLGCLIIDSGLQAYTRNLKPEDFSNKFRADVFRAISEIEGPVDLVILAEHLERNNVPSPNGKFWAGHLASLLDLVPDIENVAEYAKIVRQCAIERRLRARTAGG